LFGGLDQIKKKYGTIDAFCRDLVKSGYDKGYVSRLKKKFKREGY
jgi:hypothetical protein